MTATLKIRLGDKDFEIGPLNLRQHREIELANLKPIPPVNKEDQREGRADAYERMLCVVCSALSAKYPAMTREAVEAIPGIDSADLVRAYSVVEEFAGYNKAEPRTGEAEPRPEAAPA